MEEGRGQRGGRGDWWAHQAAPRTQSTTCSDSSQSTLDPDSSVRAVSGSSAVFGGDSASSASSLSGDRAADRRLEPLLDAADSAERAESTAEVHLEKTDGGFAIPRIHLTLEAEVPGISDDEFQRIAADAKENCPLSKVLRAADITLDATLVSS